LADANDSKSFAERRVGSSPSTGTRQARSREQEIAQECEPRIRFVRA
jgi:hypothetical protein